MSEVSQSILACLDRVDTQRLRRIANPDLAAHVAAVKGYQHARFAHTYGDMLARSSTAPACKFFLDELYGPGDFSFRDQQFRRIVPGISRFFPEEVAVTVLDLARLHALSEELDTAMAEALVVIDLRPLGREEYGIAWRAVGRSEDRETQISWAFEVGFAINRISSKRMLRTGLVMMRGPAALAGYSAFQLFLERGLTAFQTLKDPQGFLRTMAARERAIAAQLFSPT